MIRKHFQFKIQSQRRKDLIEQSGIFSKYLKIVKGRATRILCGKVFQRVKAENAKTETQKSTCCVQKTRKPVVMSVSKDYVIRNEVGR